MVAPIALKIILHYYLAVSETPDYEDSPAFRKNVEVLSKFNMSGLRKYSKSQIEEVEMLTEKGVVISDICEITGVKRSKVTKITTDYWNNKMKNKDNGTR